MPIEPRKGNGVPLAPPGDRVTAPAHRVRRLEPGQASPDEVRAVFAASPVLCAGVLADSTADFSGTLEMLLSSLVEAKFLRRYSDEAYGLPSTL